MIIPDVKAADFGAEAAALASDQKQGDYINFEEMGDQQKDGPPIQTAEEFAAQAEAEAEAGQRTTKFAATGKIAFTITDTIVPRFAGHKLNVSHTALKANVEDRQDIIDAYTAVFEYYNQDFDNPVLALIVVLGASYGLKIYDVAQDQKAAKKAVKPAEAAEYVPGEGEDDGTNAPDPDEPPYPGARRTTVVANYRSCEAPNCAKILKSGQAKFCSKECRLAGLNAKKS